MNNGTIQSIDNPRYRPTGLKQGEMQMYMVDKRSDQDGTGGTMRRVLQGLQGWVCNLLGKQIFIGDGDNDTIQIGAHKDSNGTTMITITGKNQNVQVRVEGDLNAQARLSHTTTATQSI